jgi:uncharacterized membrane protein
MSNSIQPEVSVGTEPSHTSEPRRGQISLSVPRRHLLILVGLIAAYTSVFTYLGQLRFENFYTTTWDLGINQQMLWTTAHGSLLYETPDRIFYGTKSFLEVHSTYIALLVVPLYSAFPDPATLFALQSAALASSVFPLYLLSRRVFPDPSRLFPLLALFLVNFGVITGLLYDFHWEAFIPAEFLWLYVLVRRKSYWLSVVPMVAGFLTLEVFPFLVGGVAILILLEKVQEIGRRPRALFRDRDVRVQLVFLLIALVAYLSFRSLEYLVIPPLVGSQGFSGHLAGAVSNPFTFSATTATILPSTLYWVLLLASLGFVPLFCPKSLLLSLPWFVDSFFLHPGFSPYFGNQYSLIAMATLSVALVEGWAALSQAATDLRRSMGMLSVLAAVAGIADVLAFADSRGLLSGSIGPIVWMTLVFPPLCALCFFVAYARSGKRESANSSVALHRKPCRIRRLKTPLWLGIVAMLIAFNVAMTPINPTNFEATPYPGYWLEFSSNPISALMGWIDGYIPQNAVILAANNLFPFVADNPNAWSAPAYAYSSSNAPPFMPFNGSDLPKYVLTDSSDWQTFPTGVQAVLLNQSTYGLVAYVFAQIWPGTIYLFERNYEGVAAARYATPPLPAYFMTSSNLAFGPSGEIVRTDQSRFGSVIESRPSAVVSNNLSNIWYGPYLTFPIGDYCLVFNLTGESKYSGIRPDAPILLLDAVPYLAGGPILLSVNVTASQLIGTGWENYQYDISLTEPFPLVEFRGYLYYSDGQPNGEVTLNYIELTPDWR